MLFELHCHSTYSDGKASPREIVEYAKRIGLSGIAVTDHDEIRGALEAMEYATKDFTVIPGTEVSSLDGHILGLGVRETIPRDMPAAKTIERIHSLGGFAIAAHPYDRWRRGVGDLILKLPFDAVEVLNGHTFGNRRNPRKTCEKAGIPVVGGSDAHTLTEIGLVLVEFDGDVYDAIRSNNARILNKPMTQLIIKHGIGIFWRKSAKLLRRIRNG